MLFEFFDGGEIEIHRAEGTVYRVTAVVIESDGSAGGQDDEVNLVFGRFDGVIDGIFDSDIEFGFADVFGGADVYNDDVFFGDLAFCSVVRADIAAIGAGRIDHKENSL